MRDVSFLPSMHAKNWQLICVFLAVSSYQRAWAQEAQECTSEVPPVSSSAKSSGPAKGALLLQAQRGRVEAPTIEQDLATRVADQHHGSVDASSFCDIPEGTVPSPMAVSCSPFQVGTNYLGYDMYNAAGVSDAMSCSILCQGREAAFFTYDFNQQHCWCKSAKGKTEYSATVPLSSGHACKVCAPFERGTSYIGRDVHHAENIVDADKCSDLCHSKDAPYFTFAHGEWLTGQCWCKGSAVEITTQPDGRVTSGTACAIPASTKLATEMLESLTFDLSATQLLESLTSEIAKAPALVSASSSVFERSYGSLHSIVGKDGVIMLALDRVSFRSSYVAANMNRIGIYPSKLAATDGACASPQMLDKGCGLIATTNPSLLQVGKSCPDPNRAGWGCVSVTEQAIADSHRRALETALTRDSEWTAIIEDDVMPVDNLDWDMEFKKAWQVKPPKAKFVRLNWCEATPTVLASRINTAGGAFQWIPTVEGPGSIGGCTAGYMVHKSLIPELLKVFPCCSAVDSCYAWDFFHKPDASGVPRFQTLLADLHAVGSRDYVTEHMGLHDGNRNFGVLNQDWKKLKSTRES